MSRTLQRVCVAAAAVVAAGTLSVLPASAAQADTGWPYRCVHGTTCGDRTDSDRPRVRDGN